MSKGRNRRDKAVKQQYEDFPYPPRNPEDEKKRLIIGSPSNLYEINHYLFAGKADFSGPFRALVAGGGTGDAAICLAQQLADHGDQATVTYVDLSKASRKVVEERAKVRGLTNMTFYTGSLLDLPSMELKPFDYIDCCGVLHHLEDPEEGLASLCSVLKDEGGLGLMLYATLGRTGVYHVQDALKTLYGEEPHAKRVKFSKSLVEDLPSTNWLVRNPFVGDHKLGEDAAFFDLLLHPRDRSYLVGEVVEFLASQDLGVTGFIEPVNYDPALYIKEQEALKRIRKMDMIEKAKLAEKIKGNIKTHVFYAKKKERLGPSVAKIAPHMIPLLQHDKPAEEFARGLKGLKALNVSFDGQNVSFPLPERCAEIVALMDGKRSLSDIQRELSMNWEGFRKLFAPLFKLFNDLNILWLKES